MHKVIAASASAVALLMFGWIAAGTALAQTPTAPPPDRPWPDAAPWKSNIYLGAVPEGAENARVLVFVHGMGGIAEHWWTDSRLAGYNDSYDQAYAGGYRTAFVTLNPDGGQYPTRSNWANGATLAKQLGAIADHYGVEKVDVLAHSKGGVDTQTAAVYYGASSHMENVFTLGSPHHGTPVVDAAFASPDSELAELVIEFVVGLLGGRSFGMYTLTPQYMEWFRAITDARTEDDSINYYYAAGSKPGDTFGTKMVGRYLTENHGPNDGLVTVESAKLPGDNATELYVDPDQQHYDLHIGENWFPCVDQVLQEGAPGGECDR